MKKIILFFLFTLNLFSSIGNVMALRGEANIKRGNQPLIVIKAGISLFQGDKILTKARTRVQVILKDDTIITIGSNSSFEFDTFIYDGTKNSKLKVKAHRGFFRSVTGKIGKLAPKRFTVETSSATIGIRGTDFSVDIKEASEVYKCYQGAIRIFISDLFKDLSAGERFEFKLNNIPIRKQFKRAIQKETKKLIKESAKPAIVKKIIEELNEIRTIEEFNELKTKFLTPIIPDGEACINP